MTGFEYGNTRLRSWRSRLLDGGGYGRLILAESIDQVLGALSDTPYADDVAVAVARVSGPQRLDEALRLNLAGTLRRMRSFYEGKPGAMVQLLLDRWDLHNLRTMLRLPEGPAVPEDLAALLVPAGRIDETAIRELVALPDVLSRIDLLVSWDIPSPDAARRLLRIRPAIRAGGDGSVLEHTLDEVFASRLAEVLGDEPGGAAAVLRARLDAANLLTALRLRGARLAAEPVPDEQQALFLPGGAITGHLWLQVAAGDDREAAAAVITARRLLPGWAEAVAHWVDSGDLATLARELQAATARAGTALFVDGDPLGFDIPVAFTFAKEMEMRNLRLIGRAVTHGLPAAEVAELLEVAA